VITSKLMPVTNKKNADVS